ncbi:hypothetical protein GT045_16260 [Streptomyces sp. SID486]|uniref:hypothetical protein n=1 Tax=unclassified Streptomyces TaxID=2593676 RepID=UPI00136D2E83|nr:MULTISPECIES: hypothetical protein [unclassified Streptomyces]MYW49250.1 hypothetical protein [Streptomyces sp. SID161]MYX96322.1 hypothetical protein [Streptomyces sp. SID486]
MGSGGIRRRLALGAAVLAASGALAFTATGAAQAASADGCAGREVRTLPFSTGVIQIYKQGDYVCAVTVARHPGAAQTMSVSVQARGNRPVVDRGRYRYHAGPVTVQAGHRCVWVRGTVGTSSRSSGWILC